MQPEISIITATRNAIRDLPALARTILRQPEGLVEWIVIDAESDDGTVDFLRSIRDPMMSFISESDDGIYDAWNKGLHRARGRWVMFIGADDLIDGAWLEACAAAPDVDLVYGDLEMRDSSGRSLGRVRSRPWTEIRAAMKYRMLLPHPGLAHNRALFASRRFDTSYRIAGDFHFLSGSVIASAVHLPMVQAVMRLGGVSNRPERVEAAFSENRRILAERGLELRLADRMHWWVKRCAARFPGSFLALQRLRWRVRQRL